MDVGGGMRAKDKLAKIGRAQTPPLPGPCWSQGLGSALLSTLLPFLGGVGAPWCRSKQDKRPLEHSQLIDPGHLFVQLVSRSVRTMFLTSFLPSLSIVPTEGLVNPSDFGFQEFTRGV